MNYPIFIAVKVTQKMSDDIKDRAKKLKVSVSAYIRMALYKELEK